MKRQFAVIISIVFILFSNIAQSRTLHVGNGQQYLTLEHAAVIAQPGDAILIHNGTYTQRENISNLNGEEENPIIIYAEEEGKVIYTGQSEAWHLSSCSHLFIAGFVFEKQTSNGVNIDDSGNFDQSTHHITIQNCTFKDMDASGNNDMLKLSGLDDFIIENCIFLNGAAGGSGIDMVGCHRGKIVKNSYNNMGSNCIQAKGGSQFITITQNNFKDGGMRTLNLGGSTGLEYFRPQDATFEAADIDVHSNVFNGSWSPIAFVGSVRVKVVNNTFYKPTNWVFRILQETVDTNRFLPCGYNEFSNNIIYFGNTINRVVNIGPNTNPNSFTISNNLWFNYQDDTFSDPNLPVEESNSIIQQDPKFIDVDNHNFELRNDSPALASGKISTAPELDFQDKYFKDKCSLGAFQNKGIYKDFTGEIGTSWFYDFDSLFGFQSMKILKKDTVDNYEVSVLERYIQLDDVGGEFGIFQIHTNDHIVKYRGDHDHGFGDEFHELYNFNLKVYDDMFTSLNYGDFFTRIDSVKFKYLAGKVRKEFITSKLTLVDIGDEQFQFGDPGIIIEGIYSVNSFLFGNTQFDFNGDYDFPLRPSDKLRCFNYFDRDIIQQTIQFTDYPCDTLIVGINDIPIHNNLTVFPNPAEDFINLQFKIDFTGKIEIFDLVGRKVFEQILKNQNKKKINIEALQKGIYIIKISGKNFNSYQKVMLNKG